MTRNYLTKHRMERRRDEKRNRRPERTTEIKKCLSRYLLRFDSAFITRCIRGTREAHERKPYTTLKAIIHRSKNS